MGLDGYDARLPSLNSYNCPLVLSMKSSLTGFKTIPKCTWAEPKKKGSAQDEEV